MTLPESQVAGVEFQGLIEQMMAGMAYCRMEYDSGRPCDFTYLYVNPAFERLTELVGVTGKRASELPSVGVASSPGLLETYSRVAVTGESRRVEIHQPDSNRWFEVSVCSPESGYFVATLDEISRRKARESQLPHSEERFRLLFENIMQGVVFHNGSGEITSANPMAQQILGLTLDQMQGCTSFDPRWHAVHEDGSDFPGGEHPAMVSLRTGRPVRDVVMGVFNPHLEQLRWLNICAVPLVTPGGSAPYMVFASFTDITEQRAVAQTEVRLNRALKLLRDSDAALVRTENEEGLLENICRLAVESGGYLMAWVGFAEHDAALNVRPVAQAGDASDYLAAIRVSWGDNEYGKGPTGVAIRSGTTVVNQDFLTNPALALWREAAARHGFQSSISIPLVIDGEIIGAFSIYAAEPFAFGEQEVELLEELAGDIAYGMSTLRTRIKHEAALAALQRESEKHLALLHNASDGVHILDSDGRLIEVSDSFCTMLGYGREEMLGMHVSQWRPETDAVALMQELSEQFAQGQRILFESRYRHRNGTILDVEVSALPLMLETGPVLFNSSRDITERKRQEREISENERLLQDILKTSPIAIRITSVADSRILFQNQRYEEVTNSAAVQQQGDRREYYAHAEDYDEVLHELARGHSVIDRQIELRFPSGEVSWWIASYMPIKYQHEDAVLGWFYDITERKRAEAELRIAATAFESQEGMLITDADGVILRVNRAFTDITGFLPEEIIGKPLKLLRSERQDRAFYVAISEELNKTGAWRGETLTRRKSGESYPAHLTITAVTDDHGNVINHVATLSDITLRKKSEQEIEHLAFFDHLTRLPNRRLLLDRLKRSLISCGRRGRYGALLFIDLDNFKSLNDAHGHALGDLLLQQVAERLTAVVREGDTVARLGGDEFVVILEGLGGEPHKAASQTEAIGMKILAVLSHAYQLESHEFRTTCSIGATLFNDHRIELGELLKQADIAMYQAKRSGRNSVRFFDPQMQERINARVILEGKLHKALELHQFLLHFQIQVDRLQQPVGTEALIRWRDSQGELVSPAQFILLAEESGLILPIGQWVLEAACARLKVWQEDARLRSLVLAVNISARQFHQRDFAAQVEGIVQRYAVAPSRLKLELTESVLAESFEGTIATMNRLKALGIQFSLDDFGTGYSSLQYLKRLPLDQLKIDRSFVRDIATDSNDKTIVRTIIAMAHSLNLEVVAEGVETEEQRQFLLENGCPYYQGYLFGRPLPVEQFEEVMQAAGL